MCVEHDDADRESLRSFGRRFASLECFVLTWIVRCASFESVRRTSFEPSTWCRCPWFAEYRSDEDGAWEFAEVRLAKAECPRYQQLVIFPDTLYPDLDALAFFTAIGTVVDPKAVGCTDDVFVYHDEDIGELCVFSGLGGDFNGEHPG